MLLKTGERLHLKNPEFPEKRVLHSGQAVAIEGDVVVAEFGPPIFSLVPDAEFIVFYEVKRKFVQQAARIEGVEEGAERWQVRIELIGDTAPAEGREIYRVTTLSSPVTAEFGEESGCQVVDVSSTGFALLSQQQLAVGKQILASIDHDGESYSGDVIIQSIQERKSAMRYGVRCVKRADQGSPLEDGLNLISLAVQRQQLARQGVDG